MVVVVDYNVGNPGSIINMLKKIGVPACITGDAREIAKAERIILPGVGAFDHGMQELRRRGLEGVLQDQVLGEQKLLLGICLGMQMLGNSSEEGQEPGLGWIDAETRRFDQASMSSDLRIPHMGWNWVSVKRKNRLFAQYPSPPRFYFVHSYHVVCNDEADVLASCHYGINFTCAVGKNNVFGTQFHPEKSHRFGLQLLRNFTEMQRCSVFA